MAKTPVNQTFVIKTHTVDTFVFQPFDSSIFSLHENNHQLFTDNVDLHKCINSPGHHNGQPAEECSCMDGGIPCSLRRYRSYKRRTRSMGKSLRRAQTR